MRQSKIANAGLAATYLWMVSGVLPDDGQDHSPPRAIMVPIATSTNTSDGPVTIVNMITGDEIRPLSPLVRFRQLMQG